MLFNSLNYIFFLIAVMLLYYAIPSDKLRKVFVLAASYYFYACWNVAFLGILLFVTLLSYVLSAYLHKKKSKVVLIAGIVILLLPLFTFKYINFLLSSTNIMFRAMSIDVSIPLVKLMLPVGISFFTFMAIGYVVDVNKQKIAVEKNLLDYALFVGFFPQIASGPIGRAGQLIPQLKEKQALNYDNFAIGARMMLWGFFMKLVVGDRAGIYVDTVLGAYDHHSGISLTLASFMYSIQIYCDFAGYSLIAIGSARIMGYQLMTNFMRPYFASSVGDFWRRWHISLSTWFRDYVYIPLGGNRCCKLRQYANLMVTFLISGLWHGAAWNFVLWGVLHGFCQVVTKHTSPNREKLWCRFSRKAFLTMRTIFNIVLTFITASYLWMIFRISDFSQIVEITKGYFKGGSLYMHPTTIFFFTIGFMILFAKDFKDEYFPDRHFLLESKYAVVRYASFAALAAVIIFIGILGGGQFIYFQF